MQPMPDLTALMKIARSPAGQQLLALLQSDQSLDLNTMAAAAASGNLEEAKQQLGNVLGTKEAQKLLKQLGKQLWASWNIA